MAEQRKIHFIGNAHLDPVWLWRWQEGYAEIKATFRSALDRMIEFPDFVFTCACAAYYNWVEENAPDMFEEIRTRVTEGRWVIVGGWWIQPDCNIPSGESFARQGLYSQRYFQEKFGVMAKVGYNVDSFGHNGMLPQILKKSGMDYYVFMRPEKHEKEMEANLFWWESADGSRVLTFRIPYLYLSENNRLRDKILAVKHDSEQAETDYMCFYGVGNHGGGPTITNVRTIHDMQQEYGIDNLIFSSPNTYFTDMLSLGAYAPVHHDDLQMHAIGCYSAHSETKANNRKAEHRLLTAEKFAAVAHHLFGLPGSQAKLEKSWRNVLFNQFHDVMGGCSIKAAYDDAREAYGESLQIAAVTLNAALQRISWSIDTMREGVAHLSKDKHSELWEQGDAGTPVVVFNPLSWEVRAPIHVNKNVKGITDERHNPMPIQTVRAAKTNGDSKWDTLFIATLPAMGYRVYWIYLDNSYEIVNGTGSLSAGSNFIENDYIRLEIEPHTGYIKHLFDKIAGVDVFAGQSAVPIVIDEYHSDTWGHGLVEYRDEIARFSDAAISLIEQGPLRACLRVTSRYNQSILRQDFYLEEGSAVVRVHVQLDWREKHKMLKLSFPVGIMNPRATYEIPYGFIERPVNGEEEPGQQWVDLSGFIPGIDRQSYGFALLNDSKYSFDVKDNDVRMTVVRSPAYADHFGARDQLLEYMDQGVQEFAYTLLPHSGSWQESGVVKKAYELNVPPIHIIETYHKGKLSQHFEGIRLSNEQIIATVFKQAEDGNGYILRCYESAGSDQEVTIEIPFLNRCWSARFGRCEIKSFRIPYLPEESIVENNLLEL